MSVSLQSEHCNISLHIRVVHGTSPSEGPGGPLVPCYRLRGGLLLVNLRLTAQMVKEDLACPPRMPLIQYVIQNSEEYS